MGGRFAEEIADTCANGQVSGLGRRSLGRSTRTGWECLPVKEDAADRLRETTTDSERIYEGKIVSLRVDQVELPDGGSSAREIVVHGGGVAAVPVTDAGEVLLVRQWRHPAGEVLLELPAGTLEPDEDPEVAIARELAEEIEHRAGSIEHLADIYTSPGFCTEVISLYLATDLEPAAGEADADENIEIVRMPLQKALRLCHEGGIRDGKSIAGLMLAAGRLQE